jgi:hypothetical protein
MCRRDPQRSSSLALFERVAPGLTPASNLARIIFSLPIVHAVQPRRRGERSHRGSATVRRYVVAPYVSPLPLLTHVLRSASGLRHKARPYPGQIRSRA